MTRHLPRRISLAVVACASLVIGLALPAAASNPSIATQATATNVTAVEGTPLVNVQVGTYNGVCTTPCSASIVWGDGSSAGGATITGSSGNWIISAGFTYTEDSGGGTFPTTITVTDGATNYSANGTATVDERSLVATGQAPITGPREGNVFTGQIATFVDPGSNDAPNLFSASLDWGDRGSSNGTITAGGDPGTYIVTASHTYADEGTYVITINAYESGLATPAATVTTLISIGESDLLAGVATPISASEGFGFSGNVATFTDTFAGQLATEFTAPILWGDGGSSNGTVTKVGANFVVSGSHTYLDEGSSTFTVVLQDDNSGTASATVTGTATVTEADSLSGAAAGPITGVEGTTFSGTVATFTDTDFNVSADFTATIDWGDGLTSAGVASAVSNGSCVVAGHVCPGLTITVTGSHVYDEGTFTYKVTLADDAPSVVSSTVQSTATFTRATIDNLPTPSFTAVAGVGFTNVHVATFSDNGGKEALDDYAATVFWGDGTATSIGSVVDPPGTINVFGAHTYANPGNFSVTVAIADVDGSTATSAAMLVTVAAAPVTPPTPGPARPLPIVPFGLLLLGLAAAVIALTFGKRRSG